jgi:hypothetical protein
LDTRSALARGDLGDGESILKGWRSGVWRRGGVSELSRFACCGRDDCWTRDCFTMARGTESWSTIDALVVVGSSSSGMSSSTLGSAGGVGDRTQRFEEYFVRIKFSIFASEGMCDGGNEASQYLTRVNYHPRERK